MSPKTIRIISFRTHTVIRLNNEYFISMPRPGDFIHLKRQKFYKIAKPDLRKMGFKAFPDKIPVRSTKREAVTTKTKLIRKMKDQALAA